MGVFLSRRKAKSRDGNEMINPEQVLRVGSLISLGFSVGKEFGLYSSRVEDVTASGILVSWPSDHMVQVPVEAGQDIILEVRSDRGVLRLDSHILSKSYVPFPSLVIARHGQWQHEQRRQHVRLEIVLVPSRILCLNSAAGLDIAAGETPEAMEGSVANDPEEVKGSSVSGTIRNISAGGYLLTTSRRLEPGAVLSIRFALKKGEAEFSRLSRVVWVRWDELPGQEKHKAGCQFLNLTAREQDTITKFIFSKQIERRRVGLL